MQERAKRWVVDRLAKAEANGHRIMLEHRDPPAEWADQARTKFWGCCSCGYRSTARTSKHLAISAAFHHLGQVEAEFTEAARNGVSVPGDVRPAL